MNNMTHTNLRWSNLNVTFDLGSLNRSSSPSTRPSSLMITYAQQNRSSASANLTSNDKHTWWFWSGTSTVINCSTLYCRKAGWTPSWSDSSSAMMLRTSEGAHVSYYSSAFRNYTRTHHSKHHLFRLEDFEEWSSPLLPYARLDPLVGWNGD